MKNELEVRPSPDQDNHHSFVVPFYDSQLEIFVPAVIEPENKMDNLSSLVNTAVNKAEKRLNEINKIVFMKRGTKRGARETRDIEANKERTKRISELRAQVRDLSGEGTRGIRLSFEDNQTSAGIVLVDIPPEQEDWVRFSKSSPRELNRLWKEEPSFLKIVYDYFILRLDVREGRKQDRDIDAFHQELDMKKIDEKVYESLREVVQFVKSD